MRTSVGRWDTRTTAGTQQCVSRRFKVQDTQNLPANLQVMQVATARVSESSLVVRSGPMVHAQRSFAFEVQ